MTTLSQTLQTTDSSADSNGPTYVHIITHAPLFRGGEDHVCESPLGDSCFVMNIHNPFMHCVTSQYVFKLRDVIMLIRAVTIVAA